VYYVHGKLALTQLGSKPSFYLFKKTRNKSDFPGKFLAYFSLNSVFWCILRDIFKVHSVHRGEETGGTSCDTIWQVTLRRSVIGFPLRAILGFNLFLTLDKLSVGSAQISGVAVKESGGSNPQIPPWLRY